MRNDLQVIAYESPQSDHGYKYLIRKNVYSYDAYRTNEGFAFFIESRNLELVFVEEYYSEEKGLVKIYDVIGTVQEELFWSMDEIPEDAEVFTGLSNGSLVECYYLHTNNGSIIYRPNPNAKEVYQPLPLDEHLAFQRIYG